MVEDVDRKDESEMRYDLWELLEKKRFFRGYKVVARKYLYHGEEDPFKSYCYNGRVISSKRIVGLPLDIVNRFYPEKEVPDCLRESEELSSEELALVLEFTLPHLD